MTQVQHLPHRVRDDDLFVRRIRRYAASAGEQIRILEAGCGLDGLPRLDGVDCHVTGIDDDNPVLRARTERRDDLDSWLLGDLRMIGLPQRWFHVVYSSQLLHRTRNVELVLDRILAALRPGGLVLLRFPDRGSAYGFCVRVLPGWARRYLWKRRGRRGGDGGTGRLDTPHGPLPACFEPVASHRGMQRYCLLRGLIVVEEYGEAGRFEDRDGRGRLVRTAVRLIAALSRGRLSATRTDLVFVIRKPEDRLARILPNPRAST